MTYSPIQLEAIRILGRKELTDGCIITGLCLDSYGELKERRLCRKTYAGYYLVSSHKGNFHDNCGSVHKPSSIEILGHEPHLEDVFRVAEKMENKDGGRFEVTLEISNFTDKLTLFVDGNSIPYNPSIPLLEQSEETLTQLISLFK